MLFCKLNWDFKLNNLTEEQREIFIANWPGMNKKIESRKRTYENNPEKIYDMSYYEVDQEHRLHLEEAAVIEQCGIPISIEGIDGTMLTRMKDRGDKYGDKTPLEMSSGQIVQIAVPDLGLLQINEVTWMEDACTEALQEKLEDGWRILAVCPPNAQRRPDYILGRKKTGV